MIDIGCGEGSLSAYALSQGANVVMIDISREALALATKNSFDIDCRDRNNVVVADGQHLPIRTNMIDIVVLSDVLEHMQAPEILLLESRRILKTNKGVYLIIPNAFGFYALTLDLLDTIICRLKRRVPHHVHQFTQSKIMKLLEQFKFRLDACEEFKISQIVVFNMEIKLPKLLQEYLSPWRKLFCDEWMLWALKE
jgi:ubiquinone/menaquinone biosynthesis C-methylase UbiE